MPWGACRPGGHALQRIVSGQSWCWAAGYRLLASTMAVTHTSRNVVGKVVVQSDLLDHRLHRLNVFDGLFAAFQ